MNDDYFNSETKALFRSEFCNLVEVSEWKIPLVPKGMSVLHPLQSDEEFEKYLTVKNWGITQTEDSNILFFDLDSNEYDKSLNCFFNRRRDKYVKEEEHIHSKHGFIKVVDATHEWCVEFARKYHNKCGIEIYAEGHWAIYAGTFYNPKNTPDPKRKTTWYPLDDLHKDPLLQVTKADLGLVFSKIFTNTPAQFIDNFTHAGEGKRHSAIISEAFSISQELVHEKKDITFDRIYNSLMEGIRIENISEYAKGTSKFPELEKSILWVIENFDINEVEFGSNFVSKSIFFAHIKDTDKQFNSWFWNSTKWSDNTAHFILEALLLLKSKNFKPDHKMALDIAAKISAIDKTLKVSLEDRSYHANLMTLVTNSFGKYFDFKDGMIKNVDPSKLFYKEPQLDVVFREDAEEPEYFLEFLKERFPDEYDMNVLIDHLAGALLHTSVLGTKPKMLFICGKYNTFKSLLVEILKRIISKKSISNVVTENLADKWGLSLIADTILNYSEENNAREPKDPANLKDTITKESGHYHQKYGKKLVYANRFPRHLIMCNKISPIAKDDDDDSLFIRNQYLYIKDVTAARDWRKLLLDEDELEKIVMLLLMRAAQIYNGSPLIVQDIEEAKKRHAELTQGSLIKFIEEHFITKSVTSDIGTSFNFILAKYNEVMPNTISNKLLSQQLEDLGFEKKVRNRVFKVYDEPNVYSEISSTIAENVTQQTLIMGLKPVVKTKTTVPGFDIKSQVVEFEDTDKY